MSTTNAAVADGKAPRKTLSNQLDRLDRVIDDLSEGLNQAVAHVVQQSVTQAVQQAIEGLMQAVVANPELLHTLAARLTPPTPDDPAPPAQGKSSGSPRRWAGVLAAVRRRVSALVDAVRGRLRLVRLPLLVLAVGGVAVAAAFLAGPWMVAATGCLAGLARYVA